MKNLSSLNIEITYFHNSPFRWEKACHTQVCDELDACFAHLYGPTRDELRNILVPKKSSAMIFLAKPSVC